MNTDKCFFFFWTERRIGLQNVFSLYFPKQTKVGQKETNTTKSIIETQSDFKG